MGVEQSSRMWVASQMASLKIPGSSSLRNHQLPISSHLGMELHQPLPIHDEIFFSDLILCTRTQLYQFMCTEQHDDVRQTPCGCRHPLLALDLLAPSSAMLPEPWRQRCDRHVLFRAEHSTVSCSLRVSPAMGFCVPCHSTANRSFSNAD